MLAAVPGVSWGDIAGLGEQGREKQATQTAGIVTSCGSGQGWARQSGAGQGRAGLVPAPSADAVHVCAQSPPYLPAAAARLHAYALPGPLGPSAHTLPAETAKQVLDEHLSSTLLMGDLYEKIPLLRPRKVPQLGHACCCQWCCYWCCSCALAHLACFGSLGGRTRACLNWLHAIFSSSLLPFSTCADRLTRPSPASKPRLHRACSCLVHLALARPCWPRRWRQQAAVQGGSAPISSTCQPPRWHPSTGGVGLGNCWLVSEVGLE